MSATDLDQVRIDFDRIAAAGGVAEEDHGTRALLAVLATIPGPCETALDLGCGAGGLVRRLAARAGRVTGIDVSPAMLALARERTADLPNVELLEADLMTCPLPLSGFDLVCAVATLHHLPLVPALARAASLVRPGGHLLVLDLYRPVGLRGFLENATSWLHARELDAGRPGPGPAARAAWDAHGARDRYPTLAEVRAAAGSLPGAEVAMRLPWRWSLLWRRPA